MGKSPEHMAWQFVSHSKSLKTAVRPREAWAQLGIISSFSITPVALSFFFLFFLARQPCPLALPLMAWQSARLFEVCCQHAAAARLCMQHVHKNTCTACLHLADHVLLKVHEMHRMQHARMTTHDL